MSDSAPEAAIDRVRALLAEWREDVAYFQAQGMTDAAVCTALDAEALQQALDGPEADE